MIYKGINVKQHNLKLREKVNKFLQDNNITEQEAKKFVPPNNTIKNRQHNNQQSRVFEQIQHNKVSKIQQQDEDTDSDDGLHDVIAMYKKSMQNPIKYPQSFGNSAHGVKSDYKAQDYSNQQKSNSRIKQTDVKSAFQRYSDTYTSKNKSSIKQYQQKNQFQTEGIGSDVSVGPYEKKKAKNKKKQKMKIEEEASKVEQFQNYEQLNTKPTMLDLTNKYTLSDLKNTNKPLTRNYRIGNKQQWQSNQRIRDYQLKMALKGFTKIKDYKNNQKAIIKCSLLNNDVFVCMPTGGGKSLTFQVMTFIQRGIYLCILPLVSLIMDQQYHAKNYGIKAYSLTGAKQISDNKKIYNQILNYEEDSQSIVIFCTPQKVSKSPQFVNALEGIYERNKLVKIVIDEVHCVSTWGKQFREDYENLSALRSKFPKTPILGLTATVTQVIKQDIITRLGIENCYYFQSSFNRPNLIYEVRVKGKSLLNEILVILQQYKNKCGIIYCLSRKQCEEMCEKLKSRKHKVAFYHANINENQKRSIQTQWMENKIQIIIATIAFGMGINKPDVRFVIHHSLSKSLENYYQESGRAGRDGDEAKCILFYKKSDKISLQSLIMKNQFSDKESKSFCMKQLSNMIKYCEDKYTCRRKFQLEYLGQIDFDVKQCANTCDNCKHGLSYYEFDAIKEAKVLVEFMIDVDRMRQTLSQNQIILLCKGSSEKKFQYKTEQISRNLNVEFLKELFKNWSKQQIDQLITQLCSNDIFNEKIVTVNTFKNNKVSNVYLKVNFTIANRFLKKVDILPMKTVKVSRKANKNSNAELSDWEIGYDEEQVNDKPNQNGGQQQLQQQNNQNSWSASLEERYSFK